MIVLSEIQGDLAKVKQLPALLRKKAKKPLPEWYVAAREEVARMSREEIIAMMDETLAGFDK